MPPIYRLSRSGVRLLYKIRHHKGHGIHSPFVFNFITKVIEEKTPYYAYLDINKYLNNFSKIKHKETKLNRLTFKVINYFNPKKILEIGAGNGINTLYLTATSSDIECLSIEINPEKQKKAQELLQNWDRKITLSSEIYPQLKEHADCIYINLRNFQPDESLLIPYLMKSVNKDSFIFIDGIRTNRKRQALWKKLIKQDEVIVSFDLFHVGILFFNKKYFKHNYKLSF